MPDANILHAMASADIKTEEVSPLQARLLATYMSALKDQEEKLTPPSSPSKPPAPAPTAAAASKNRSDLYSKKLGELLLKGWKMLGENCPDTNEVPLMQNPSTGKKFSIATGRYVDDDEADSPSAAEVPAPAAAPARGRPMRRATGMLVAGK